MLTFGGSAWHTHSNNRRKVYDQTGETDEDLMGDKFTEVYDFFRAMFKQVTPEDIDDFAVSWRGG